MSESPPAPVQNFAKRKRAIKIFVAALGLLFALLLLVWFKGVPLPGNFPSSFPIHHGLVPRFRTFGHTPTVYFAGAVDVGEVIDFYKKEPAAAGWLPSRSTSGPGNKFTWYFIKPRVSDQRDEHGYMTLSGDGTASWTSLSVTYDPGS